MVLEYVSWNRKEAVSAKEVDTLAQVQTFQIGIGIGTTVETCFLYFRFL